MSRKAIAETIRKQIAGKQSYKCANGDKKQLSGLEAYKCPLWNSKCNMDKLYKITKYIV